MTKSRLQTNHWRLGCLAHSLDRHELAAGAISEALSCVVAVGNVFYPALEGSVEVERNDRHRRELSDVASG